MFNMSGGFWYFFISFTNSFSEEPLDVKKVFLHDLRIFLFLFFFLRNKLVHFLWSKQVRMAKGSFQFTTSVPQGKQTPLQLHPPVYKPIHLANTELYPSCPWAVSYSFALTRVSVLNDRLSLVLMHNVRMT